MEFALREIRDIIAEIPGSVEKDHPVILGAHGDSWGPGASDNGGGIACLLEVGRALAALTREGWRPRRTIMLGSWDAEEFGIMGSTEWVEENEGALHGAAAYLNVDGAASGPRFEVAASPTLAGLFRDVAADLPAPEGPGTLLAAWRRASGSGGAEGAIVGPLGGGSDFSPFLNHLGVPSANHAFSGEGGGAYHSSLDTWRFVSRYLDPGMVRHAAVARVWAMAAVRLASAAVIPYDPAATGREVRAALKEMRGAPLPGINAIEDAIGHADRASLALEIAAARFRRAVATALSREEPPTDSTLTGVNDLVIDAERALVSSDGLPGRSWYRYLLVAPSGGSGYGTTRLPGVRDALEAGEPGTAERQLGLLASGVEVAERRLREAAKLIRGR